MSILGDTTLNELFEDREQLDCVVRSVGIELDVGYVEAFGLLDEWAKEAAKMTAHNRAGETQLEAVIDQSPIMMDQLERDLTHFPLGGDLPLAAEQRLLNWERDERERRALERRQDG